MPGPQAGARAAEIFSPGSRRIVEPSDGRDHLKARPPVWGRIEVAEVDLFGSGPAIANDGLDQRRCSTNARRSARRNFLRIKAVDVGSRPFYAGFRRILP